MTEPVRNAPSALPTMLRFAGRRLRHRLSGGAARTPVADFRSRVDSALASLAPAIAEVRWHRVPAGASHWHEAVVLPDGAQCTLITGGWLHVSRLLDVGLGAKSGLWYRVGDGEARKVRSATHTVHAAHGGRLDLMATLPGEFSTRRGDFGPDVPRARIGGAFDVAVVVWRAQARTDALSAADAALFGEATDDGDAAPPGWYYLWRLGEGRIYDAGDAGEMACCTHADVGILQHPVDVPLDADLALTWQWQATRLPSELPEHTEPTHDYLSIAVEFDNGLDLTYMWSAALPVDTIFQCPLSWWKERETHWVIRNDPAELGQWLTERRSILADYRRAIGGSDPARVVGVWLIANSVFQRGVGECRYRDIRLSGADGDLTLPVQPDSGQAP